VGKFDDVIERNAGPFIHPRPVPKVERVAKVKVEICEGEGRDGGKVNELFKLKGRRTMNTRGEREARNTRRR
jgi:hypothetical protein